VVVDGLGVLARHARRGRQRLVLGKLPLRRASPSWTRRGMDATEVKTSLARWIWPPSGSSSRLAAQPTMVTSMALRRVILR